MSRFRIPRTLLRSARTLLSSSPISTKILSFSPLYYSQHSNPFYSLLPLICDPIEPKSLFLPPRLFSTITPFKDHVDRDDDNPDLYESPEEGDGIDEWEEEEEDAEPEPGDGGGGGGVVLQGLPWGETALSIAREVLLHIGDDMNLYAFKITPRGYIYVRLDKLSNLYGCPSMEELESYSKEYKKRLDEAGADRYVPDDLALEVSSPGAERLLKVPDDVHRFKDMPMNVCYIEETESNRMENNGVFILDSVETKSESCVWKLANVKENRDPQSKGKPLSRKQKDWRLKLPFTMIKRVTLYLS